MGEFRELTLPWKLCGARSTYVVNVFDAELWVCDEHVRAALCHVLDLDPAYQYKPETITFRRLPSNELLEHEQRGWDAGCVWGVSKPLPRDVRN